jgi:hypothetical protein
MSVATAPTLGKRQTRESAEGDQLESATKRQRKTSPCRLAPESDVIRRQDDAPAQNANTLNYQQPSRAVQSAPNSNNGSTNLQPQLDTQFELPQSMMDPANEEGLDSNNKKEKR